MTVWLVYKMYNAEYFVAKGINVVINSKFAKDINVLSKRGG